LYGEIESKGEKLAFPTVSDSEIDAAFMLLLAEKSDENRSPNRVQSWRKESHVPMQSTPSSLGGSNALIKRHMRCQTQTKQVRKQDGKRLECKSRIESRQRRYNGWNCQLNKQMDEGYRAE